MCERGVALVTAVLFLCLFYTYHVMSQHVTCLVVQSGHGRAGHGMAGVIPNADKCRQQAWYKNHIFLWTSFTDGP